MADPGYGPNGERIDPLGVVSWKAQGPPQIRPVWSDRHEPVALGLQTIPFIDQDDEDVWAQAGPFMVLPPPFVDLGLVDIFWDDGDNLFWDDGDNMLWDS